MDGSGHTMQAWTCSTIKFWGDLIAFLRSALVILHMSSDTFHGIRASVIASIIELHLLMPFNYSCNLTLCNKSALGSDYYSYICWVQLVACMPWNAFLASVHKKLDHAIIMSFRNKSFYREISISVVFVVSVVRMPPKLPSTPFLERLWYNCPLLPER